MKFTFRPSPNYRQPMSTDGIMADLTAALLAVATYSVITYWLNYGASYGLRIILMLVVAVASALCTEGIYYKIRKADVKKEILHSYSWVTAIILVLITKINVSLYAVAVSTIIAIVFGKLVFGGFGQNIFNPAAFGEAIIMNSFASSTAADFTTGATPLTTMSTSGWVMNGTAFSSFLSQFGGWGGLLTGTYPSVIGGSCAIAILIAGAYLLWKKDIDWHIPAVYLGTIFILSLIVGLIHGEGIWFALFNLLSGGVLFGAVFMLTDPVTNPITIPARVVFAVGAACLTLIIRWKANLPDGVLFSILLMNMLVPAIDKTVDGNQIKDAASIRKKVCIISVICMAIAIGVGASLTATVAETGADTAADSATTTAEPASTATAAATEVPEGSFAMSGDYSSTNVTCKETSNDGSTGVYECTAKGFEGTNEATVTVDLSNMTISSIEVTAFNDTEGTGDAAITDDALSAYEGASSDSVVDGVTGATYTSKSIAAMASAALALAAE